MTMESAVSFTGFEAADFAAYEEPKWGSNVFTLERMKAKEHLKALMKDVIGVGNAIFAGITWAYSDESPTITNNKKVDAQWAYGIRDERDQVSLRRFLEKTKLNADDIFSLAEYFKHLSLAVKISEKGCEVKLFLHQDASIDRANFAARLGKTMEQGLFLDRIKALPAGISLKLNGEVVSLSDAGLIARLTGFLNDESDPLELGWFDTAEDIIAAGAAYSSTVSDRLSALMPVYRYAAWSRDNDHIDVAQQVVKVKKQAQKVQSGIAKGDKVRLIGGLFVGKNGVVVELDGRGSAKVSLGGLAVNVALSDCERQ